MSTYKELTQQWKDNVKSYNVNINTKNTGTYIDIVANATGAVASGVNSYVDMVELGNQLETANEYMLEQWASSLGLVRRKTGFYSTGNVKLTITGSTLLVPAGTIFTFANFTYTAISDTTVDDSGNDLVAVQAEQVGAEYNIVSGVTLETSLSGVESALSDGISGGSGIETIPELKQRIKLNIAFRKTDSMASDFSQYALEIFNYAFTSVIFDSTDVVPVGANVLVANTIENYELASTNPIINEIAASTQQLEDLLGILNNFKNTIAYMETSTVNTQVVNGLEVNYTADKTLSTEENDTIIEKTRESLLQFQDSILYPRSLNPDIGDIVTSYYFTDFTPIEKTSVQMDSITITATQYSL